MLGERLREPVATGHGLNPDSVPITVLFGAAKPLPAELAARQG